MKNDRGIDVAWQHIFNDLKLNNHPFDKPVYLTHDQIKKSTAHFTKAGQTEIRLLTYQTTKNSRPQIFKDKGLFLLPVSNEECIILKGDGYIDIEPTNSLITTYNSKLGFKLTTSDVGDSEMQHLDYAFATSVIRTFMDDDSLCQTIRGRQWVTSEFSFKIKDYEIKVNGVQTEVDGGYEGKDKVVLIEAKPESCNDLLIRQLYYPFRKWSEYLEKNKIRKKVYTLLFQQDKKTNICSIRQFEFDKHDDYNSIKLVRSCRYKVDH